MESILSNLLETGKRPKRFIRSNNRATRNGENVQMKEHIGNKQKKAKKEKKKTEKPKRKSNVNKKIENKNQKEIIKK